MTLVSDSLAGTRPLRADAQRNRRRILVAAAELFAARGLDVGLDEIARHAGVGTGTVYRRFPDKALLIEALFEDRMGAMIDLAQTASRHPDPWTGLVALLEGMGAMQMANRGLKELMFGDSCPRPPGRDRRHEMVPLIQDLIARAQDAGQVRPDLDHTDVALIQLMLNAAGGFTADVHPDLWRRMLGLLLDGLRTHRSGPSPLMASPLTLGQLQMLCGIGSPPVTGHPQAPDDREA
jgi:AcrR family transcriptional regulator